MKEIVTWSLPVNPENYHYPQTNRDWQRLRLLGIIFLTENLCSKFCWACVHICWSFLLWHRKIWFILYCISSFRERKQDWEIFYVWQNIWFLKNKTFNGLWQWVEGCIESLQVPIQVILSLFQSFLYFFDSIQNHLSLVKYEKSETKIMWKDL